MGRHAMTQRRLLIVAASVLPGMTLVAAVGIPCRAYASKANRQDFAYQDKPKEGKRCAACRQFTPSAAGIGVCSVVEGNVSADGWCMAYSPRDVAH